MIKRTTIMRTADDEFAKRQERALRQAEREERAAQLRIAAHPKSDNQSKPRAELGWRACR
jgi:hypothetical protein